MPNVSTAVINLSGKDQGLSAVLGTNLKALQNLTAATIKGSEGFNNYSSSASTIQDTLAGVGSSAKSVVGAIGDVSSTATRGYQLITNNSERTVKSAEALDNIFNKLTLSALGFGGQTSKINSVLQPTAGFLGAVASETTGLGKAFTVLNQLEQPVVGGLQAGSKAATFLSGAFGKLGVAGQFASGGMASLAGALDKFAGTVQKTDTVGDIYQALEKVKEILPEIVENVQAVTGVVTNIAQTVAPIIAAKSATEKFNLAMQALAVVGRGAVKDFALLYNQITGYIGVVKPVITAFSTLGSAIKSTIYLANDFDKSLASIDVLGVNTSAARLVTSLGLVGENLLLNTKASKEFADTCISEFAKVQDSVSFITTLGAGQEAGIPALSKQLSELVDGPLQNTITKGEAANAMYQTLSAGIGAATGKLKESQPFMEAALKLASGTETNASTTVETLAKVTYAYNLNVKDASKTAGILAGIVDQGIITFPQLAGGIGRVAGVAAQAKIPLTEMAGSISALTKTMSGDDAMTGYMSLINSIAGAGEQATKSAAELGVQFDLQAVKSKGLLNVLKELYDKSGGNVARIKEIIPDSLAFSTSLTLMTTAFKDAKTQSEAIGKATGDNVDQIFGARQQSLIKQTTALMNGYQEVLAKFGEKFAPALQPGLDFLRELLNKIKDLPEPFQTILGSIVAFNAGLEKAQGFISIIISTITKLGGAFLAYRIAILSANGQIGSIIGGLKDVVKVGATTQERLASLRNAFDKFTGATETATRATENFKKGQSALSKVSTILNTDIGKSAIAKEKQRIKRSTINDLLEKPEYAGAASDITTGLPANAQGRAASRVISQIDGQVDKSIASMSRLEKAAITTKFAFSQIKDAAAAIASPVTNLATKLKQAGLNAIASAKEAELTAAKKNEQGIVSGNLAPRDAAAVRNAAQQYVNQLPAIEKVKLSFQSLTAALRENAIVSAKAALVEERYQKALNRTGNQARLAAAKTEDERRAIEQRLRQKSQAFANDYVDGMKEIDKASLTSKYAMGQLGGQIATVAAKFPILGAGLKIFGVAAEFAGQAVKALWAAFGPLAVALLAAKTVFDALGDVLPINILGMETAASKAKGAAAKYQELRLGIDSVTNALGEQNKQLDETRDGLLNQINALDKLQEREDNAEDRKKNQQNIDALKYKQDLALKTNDKKYGFLAGTAVGIFDALGAVRKVNSYIDPTTYFRGGSKARDKAVEARLGEEARNIGDSIQGKIDEVSGKTAFSNEVRQDSEDLYQKQNRNALNVERNNGVTKTTRDLLELTKNRKLTSEELLKISTAETKALEANKKQIDAQVSALQALLEEEKNPERRKAYQQDIADLNKLSGQYEKSKNAATEYLNAINSIRDRIYDNTYDPKKKIEEQLKENDKLGGDLTTKIKSAKNANEKALAENQKAAVDGNSAMLKEIEKGMDTTSGVQKKELNSLLTAYKEFTSNALNSKKGKNFADLGAMQAKADKLLTEVESNADNLAANIRVKIVDGILKQKIKDPTSNAEGGILSVTQIKAALAIRAKLIEEEVAQKEVNTNNRAITKIEQQEALGRKRSVVAQKETIQLQIKNDEILLKAKQENLTRLDYGKETEIYKKAQDEIVTFQNTIEQKKLKVFNLGLDNRAELLERSQARESALLDLSINTGLLKERAGQQKLFELRQKQNLDQRKIINDRIAGLKKNGGDFAALEVELLKLQSDFQVSQVENNKRLLDQRYEDKQLSVNKERSLLEGAFLSNKTSEDNYKEELFRLRKQDNLDRQAQLAEQIADLKKRNKDARAIEIELVQARNEAQKIGIEEQARATEEQKAQITNASVATVQSLTKQVNLIDLQSNRLQRLTDVEKSRNDILGSEYELTQGRLDNQLKLTGDIIKSASLEAEIAKNRYSDLTRTQAIEKQQLITQTKLQELSLKKEVINNRIAKAENQRAIALIDKDIAQAKRENKSQEELDAILNQRNALVDQKSLIESQTEQLSEQIRTSKEIAANSKSELENRQLLAREGGAIDLELAKRKQILAVYEKMREDAQLYAQEIDLINTKETNKAEGLTKIYERQTSILEAQKSAIDSKTNRVTSELQIALDLTKSETKKRDLAQAIAQIKYRSLMSQQQLEQKVLELQILQNKAAVEREKIQLRAQQAQNKADILGAYADAQKVFATPTSTDAQKRAAQLTVEAKMEQGAALAFTANQLEEKAKTQDFFDGRQRENLADSQAIAKNSAMMEVVNNLSPREKKRAERYLKRKFLGDNLGFDYRNNSQNFQDLRAGNKVGAAQILGGEFGYREGYQGEYQRDMLGKPGIQVGIRSTEAPTVNPDNYEQIRGNFMAMMQEFILPTTGKQNLTQKVRSSDKPVFELPKIAAPGGGSKTAGDQAKSASTNSGKQAESFGDVHLTIDNLSVTVQAHKEAANVAATEVSNAILDQLHNLGTKLKTRLGS